MRDNKQAKYVLKLGGCKQWTSLSGEKKGKETWGGEEGEMIIKLDSKAFSMNIPSNSRRFFPALDKTSMI